MDTTLETLKVMDTTLETLKVMDLVMPLELWGIFIGYILGVILWCIFLKITST